MPDHHRLPLARDIRAGKPDGARGEVRSLDEARERRDLMQIGDLARETGKTVRAIHLYEELGLLTPAARSKGRFRLYGSEALLRIRWIGKLQEMGFSLGDIQTVVHEWERVESARSAMKRMRDVYARKLADTQAQRRRLEALEQELEASLAYLEACDVCDPHRLLSACQCCDIHDKEADVPELVLGFRAQVPHSAEKPSADDVP
ncbi:MAG: MerR family transcriptional regulator [Polyangiaceae bacterium]|nr:MerR family transcriptional regulator [Polyangiaceae bacterium]